MNQVYTNVDLHYRSSELDQKQQKVGAFFSNFDALGCSKLH